MKKQQGVVSSCTGDSGASIPSQEGPELQLGIQKTLKSLFTQRQDCPQNSEPQTRTTSRPGKDKTPFSSLRRELGLLEGFTMILGNVIGSGIFVAPKGVIKYVGSVGMSLMVWAVSGLLSMLGALCFAELGKSLSVLVMHFGNSDSLAISVTPEMVLAKLNHHE